MKIGFVLDDRLDKPDGVQQYVQLLGSWLTTQGHEVHYLVGKSPHATQTNVHNLSKTVAVRFNKNRMAIPLPASKRRISTLLNSQQFDVLHVQMPYSPLLAARVVSAAPKHTAIVGTFHILPHGALSSAATKVLSAVLKNNKKRFDGFLSVSSAAQAFAKTHFGINSTVLPNVVDLTRYARGEPLKQFNNKKNIIFLGRFVDRKGARYAIAAYEKLLLITNIPVRLILCGDGPEKDRLTKQTDAINHVNKDIIFAGFLPEQDKPNYLASADIAVFPATGGESFGIVLIEAMASGAHTVLGGDNVGYKTVLGNQPLSLVHPQNSDLFAQRLKHLLTNTLDADTLHAMQQEVVKQYDITFIGPQIVAFYQKHLHNEVKEFTNHV